MAFISAGGYTAPLGLPGDTKNNAFVRGVLAASSCSTVTRNSVASVVGTTTGSPPARVIASGYVVQYGAGSTTSSPGSTIVCSASYTACLAPFVTSTWDASQSTPESRRVFSAMARRSSGSPAVGE
jgi:hypothetical protein